MTAARTKTKAGTNADHASATNAAPVVLAPEEPAKATQKRAASATTEAAPVGKDARGGASAARGHTVEELGRYVRDYERVEDGRTVKLHEIVEEVRTRVLSSSDKKPITMDVDDATLACLECDSRVKKAVEKTGHSFREILKNCQLVLDGQPDYPSTWHIRWPCRFMPGFIPHEHGPLIRAVLFLVWPFSADDLGDDDLMHRHDRAVDWMAHYVAGVDLTAARVRLDAERQRRQNGGRAAAMSENRKAVSLDDVRKEWNRLTNPRHERAAIMAGNLGISDRQARRLIKKAGLR